METQNELTCSVNTDLMLLYTRGRTTPETNRAVETHIAGCQACALAFAREAKLGEKAAELEGANMDSAAPDSGPWEAVLLPAWGIGLYLATRALGLLNRPLRRLGISVNGPMIRLYRARRKLAGRLTRPDPAAPQPA